MPPYPTNVLDLIDAFRRSKTMFAAVALGVFDIIDAGPTDATGIAAATDTKPDLMERLLDACVGLGFLRKDGPLYENTPEAATFLCRHSPHTMSGYILYSNNALFPMWAHLEDALREGTPRWEQTFGPGGGIFSHFFRTEESTRDFLAGMHGFGMLSSPAVVAAFDLSRFHRLIDLGGGTGHLALAALDRYPQLEAAVFELPRVIEFARPFVSNRVELIAGDFFTDPLPAGDLYVLSRVIHDWSEERILILLRDIHAVLPERGAVLIAEKLLDEDKTGPVPAQMQSLNMLICTEGKERSLAEYRQLLASAGFRDVQAVHTGAPLDAVFAVKAG